MKNRDNAIDAIIAIGESIVFSGQSSEKGA